MNRFASIINKIQKLSTMKLSQQQQKRLFQQHLQAQQKTRQQKQEQKKLAEQMKKNPQEHMLYIQKQFKSKSQNLEQSIKKYKEKSIGFGDLMNVYAGVKEYYVTVSYVLKTYDRQIYKEQLDKMYNTIIELKKKHEPRKKFKFSRREEDFGVKAQNQQQQIIKKNQKISQIPGLQNLTNTSLTIPRQSTQHQPYKILSCTNTTITLLNQTQILFIKHLKNCTIHAALTKSTVFIDNCQNCTIQINCHQLRIHNCYDTTFSIFVTSKAIIQDCQRVKFKRYGFEYEGREEDQVVFERVGKENLWRDIQDFNWLKENIKSPHYQLIQDS